MRVSARLSEQVGVLLLAATLAAAAPAVAEAPRRVVSINLCTDQLAMMLAAPGQLLSVSHLATEPQISAMVEEARAYPANRGQAEEVFLMRPDLVLAGTFTARQTVDLLRRLGIEVIELPPANAFADIPDQLRTVGRALGREARAEELVAEFEADLARLRVDLPPARAALYYPRGYTTGSGTLADAILRHTGFSNVAAELGLDGGGDLPLERLVMAQPQMIVTSSPYPGASRAEELLDHPALQAVREEAGSVEVSDGGWICGTPAVLQALEVMGAARRSLAEVRLTELDGPR
ncbi:iron complex transport system substrate-binding protein [[Luteovulum] sphaeroides subsp. megalophilum]|uniref:ABC transporter substrate-binding protein n=1 Tax=Cereibacter sphaeroides TaxID=1063 RepID=UPI000B6B9A77|nr:iron complex transport system substrate-binding protein [[Luteovulum] sphaeroides subsp. megalophilum]